MRARRILPTFVWLWTLFLTSLVLFTDDYVIAGILPELARDMAVSEGLAGQLITVFSLAVAIAGPVFAILLGGIARRTLIVSAMLVFSCANLIGAMGTSFGLLVWMRIAAALCAASVTPALFWTAATMAPDGKAGRYIAVVSLGVTGSIAVGVPLGSWIGAMFGWRWTFGAMAGGGLVAAAMIWLLLPEPSRTPRQPLQDVLAPLASRPLILGFVANLMNMVASMMLLTYLSPFLTDVGNVPAQARGLIFGVAGFAGMIGIWLGGAATDRWGSHRALSIGMAAFVLSMILLTIMWVARPVAVTHILPVVAIWAGAAFWNSPAITSRIFELAGASAQQAMALNTSFTYLGVASGGALGGVLLDLSGTAYLAPVSAAIGLAALVVLRMAR